MGIGTVAVYSDADRTSLHVRIADEAEHIGPSPSSQSYLRIDRIIDAARKYGAEAIHPGYGFLSENADFAEACENSGIAFVGPSAAAIRKLGSKTTARETAITAGVPVVPGTAGAISVEGARSFASGQGYPVLLKAVAGGGGKGMRLVNSEPELDSAFRDASSEAERSFRDPRIYVEKVIQRPRHIEIQLIGDMHGNLVHLGERECSIQRRHQKVMEECPSPLVASISGMREAMGEAAIRSARVAGYHNAGTVEFLVDHAGRFYFLEVNTRLQVEHPVTEWVTGLDLVRLQLEVAAGNPLPFDQQQVAWRGSAIECRIYAEDPDNNFYPSPGRITRLSRPLGPGIRIDGCIYSGWTVPVDYDPLLAKMAVWAGTRKDAIARSIRALREYDVAGIKTNIGFFRQILDDEDFVRGDLHTGFIDEFFARKGHPLPGEDAEAVAALVACLHHSARPAATGNGTVPVSGWRISGRDSMLR
jgi:acetyl-CoA carboxylase, biotin carboxylase subunit